MMYQHDEELKLQQFSYKIKIVYLWISNQINGEEHKKCSHYLASKN